MSDTLEKPKTGATAAPAATVSKARTPEQELKDGAKARKAVDDAKGAENQALMDAGKVVAPGPITGYETARERLTTADEADTESK